MGLFDKKFCDICGEKISLLGNRKLEDGNMCNHCAKLISPFMTDRRQTTIAEMKEHLKYRENNKQNLSSFSVHESYEGGYKKVYIDKSKGAFIVSGSSPDSWEKENPDIIPLNEVTSCKLEVKEDRNEEYFEDNEGNRRSYSPPRYTYSYDFYIHIMLSNKWFNEIDFKLNDFDVDGLNSVKYMSYQQTGQQIVSALTGASVNNTQAMGYGMNPSYNQNGNTAMGGVGFNAFAGQTSQYQQNGQYQQNMQYPQNGQYQQNMQYGQNGQYQQNMQYGQNGQYQQAGQYQPNRQFDPNPPYGQNANQQNYSSQTAGEWFCTSCGTKNSGKFCCGCGSPRQ